MNQHKLLEIIEYVFLSLIVVGTIAATITQEWVYAIIPLIFSITLNLINRPRLNSAQLQSQIQQLQETMNNSNQRLQQIETWRQHLNQLIDQKIEDYLSKLSNQVNEMSQQFTSVNQRVKELDDTLQNLSTTLETQGKQISVLQSISDQESPLKQQMNDIEQQLQTFMQNREEELAELNQNNQDQELEVSQISQELGIIKPQIIEINKSIQVLQQTLVEKSQTFDKLQQEQSAKTDKLTEMFESVNESLQNLDNLQELNTAFDALIQPFNVSSQINLNRAIPVTSNSDDNDDNTDDLLFVGTLEGHENGITTIAFSPDSKILASGSKDKTIRIWNLFTQEHLTWKGDNSTDWFSGINSIAFSPSGKFLAGGGNDKIIKIWDVATGREILTLSGHKERVNSVAFNPTGKVLASGSKDKTVKIWSLETGQEIYSFHENKDQVLCVVFSPDGKLLASCGGANDKMIKIIKLGENKVSNLIVNSDWFAGGINTLSFHPHARILASADQNRNIQLWDVVTGKEIKVFTGHSDHIYSIAFSPDGKILASASQDKTVKLLNINTGTEIKSVKCGNDAIYDVAFSPDGRLLAAGSGNKIIMLNQIR